MTFALLVLPIFGGFGLGFLAGLVARRSVRWVSWVVSALLVLGAFWVPAFFILDRAQYVLSGVVSTTPSLNTLAFQFAALSVLALAVSLLLALGAAVKRPFLAPLAPPIMFVLYYSLVLPLAYRVQFWEAGVLIDNIPTVWLFFFCGVATLVLIGHALGKERIGERWRRDGQ